MLATLQLPITLHVTDAILVTTELLANLEIISYNIYS